MGDRRRQLTGVLLAAIAAVVADAPQATAQLRIVDYNIAQNSQFNSDPTGLNLILASIAAESVNGIARPIDVLANQELSTNGTETAFIVGQLNAVYGAGTYAAAPVPAGAVSGGNGLPSLIYNTTTVSLLDTIAFGNVGSGSTQQPRSTLRYQLQPIGYDSTAAFYVYNSHYKSDDTSTDKMRRNVEATSIRANSDALGDGINALYVGDYNVYTSGEQMFQTLVGAGNGQAFDPLDASGTPGVPSTYVTWSGNAAYKQIHSQSPRATSEPPAFSGQVRGGMNDRFDFQLITGELQDGEGLSIIPGSYHVFGNNGTHSFGGSISSGTGAENDVLTALSVVTDHLPVVADYQLPAKMGVQVASIPLNVTLGSVVTADVLIQNLAPTLSALGADELDYTLSVSGDLFGGASGSILAASAGESKTVTLNTSTAGMKSGVITVSSASQSAANAMFTLPVSFTVDGSGGHEPVFVRKAIARDNFDTTLREVSFNQSPAAGAFSAPSSGFQQYQVGVSATIPFSLVDDSAGAFPNDQQGIINSAAKTDAWFGVTDTVNDDNAAVNPTGEGTATWAFDVSGATDLEISIDMGAMGDFEATGNNRDRFDWTYSIDGGAFLPLFTSSVTENFIASYILADGEEFLVDDPLFMTNAANQTVQLSNVLQTLTSAIAESGSLLTIQLIAKTDGQTEAYAFDNIVITGLVETLAADFNDDGDVDAQDLAAWTSNFGLASGAMKSDGDADADGDVDGHDLAMWQEQLDSGVSAAAAVGAAPEPGSLMLAAWGLAAWAANRRTRR